MQCQESALLSDDERLFFMAIKTRKWNAAKKMPLQKMQMTERK